MAPQIATHSPNDTSNTRISASPRFSHKTALGSERTDGRGSTATLQQSGGQARSAPIFVHLLLASRPEQRERLFSIAEAQLRLPEAHPDPGDSGRAVPGERGGVGRPSNRDNQGSKLGAVVGVKCGIGGPTVRVSPKYRILASSESDFPDWINAKLAVTDLGPTVKLKNRDNRNPKTTLRAGGPGPRTVLAISRLSRPAGVPDCQRQ